MADNLNTISKIKISGKEYDIKAPQTLTEAKSYTDAQIADVNDTIAAVANGAVVLKGTVGSGGTISTLPTASSSCYGHAYKVVSSGTYNNIAAKKGDMFICYQPSSSTYAWMHIPSGDDIDDTWREIKVGGTSILGNGIDTGAVNFAGSGNVSVTNESGTIKIHTDANKTTVDSSLSDSSTNPVQNKVIKTALDAKLGKTEKASDSDKLDGQDSSYYLNYNNLTNKPDFVDDKELVNYMDKVTIDLVNNKQLADYVDETVFNNDVAYKNNNEFFGITSFGNDVQFDYHYPIVIGGYDDNLDFTKATSLLWPVPLGEETIATREWVTENAPTPDLTGVAMLGSFSNNFMGDVGISGHLQVNPYQSILLGLPGSEEYIEIDWPDDNNASSKGDMLATHSYVSNQNFAKKTLANTYTQLQTFNKGIKSSVGPNTFGGTNSFSGTVTFNSSPKTPNGISFYRDTENHSLILYTQYGTVPTGTYTSDAYIYLPLSGGTLATQDKDNAFSGANVFSGNNTFNGGVIVANNLGLTVQGTDSYWTYKSGSITSGTGDVLTLPTGVGTLATQEWASAQLLKRKIIRWTFNNASQAASNAKYGTIHVNIDFTGTLIMEKITSNMLQDRTFQRQLWTYLTERYSNQIISASGYLSSSNSYNNAYFVYGLFCDASDGSIYAKAISSSNHAPTEILLASTSSGTTSGYSVEVVEVTL